MTAAPPRSVLSTPPEKETALPLPGIWHRIFLPYAVGYFLSYLLRNVNAVMAPDFSASLGLSAADLGLLTGAYLAAFALMQLPLGIALDRYGPRQVQTALLVVAAAGCGAFALGQSLGHLIVARGLIGLGVSACLMASYKAFSQWFPPTRQASLNAAIMVSGGLGALTASTPFGFLLPIVGWRWIFAGLALLGLGAAWAIWRTPDGRCGNAASPLSTQLAELGAMLRGRPFWRFAPMTAMMIGGFIAIQSLWAVPWLMGVDGLDRDEAAVRLLLLNLALMCGYTGIATGAGHLARRGIALEHLLVAGCAGGLAIALLLVLGIGPGALLWFVLGLVSSPTNLCYALHAGRYPGSLSGRANTCLNLGVFVCSFALQWGFGAVVDRAQGHGLARADALTFAWGLLLAMQAVSLLWFVASGRWERRAKQPQT